MNYRGIFKIIGIILIAYSFSFLIPLIIRIHYPESNSYNFTWSFLITIGLGLIFWLPNVKTSYNLKTKDGFLVVTLLWFLICLLSALPFMLCDTAQLNFYGSFFEAVSGITTTGASAIPDLSIIPHDLLYYRAQMQFLGGMGFIVIAVALLPKLKIGGMQLIKAEATGTNKDNKITPKITNTAKTLWIIYLILNVFCILSFHFGGMDIFDAICYGFATISTGGFAPYNESFARFNSDFLCIICMIFMIIGALNFSLHFIALKSKSIKHYFQDPECFGYFVFLFFCIAIVFFVLVLNMQYLNLPKAFLNSAFHVISMSTTTGYLNDNFAAWPTFLPLFIIYICIIGGCSGSTSGGIKFIRVIMFLKQSILEFKRLIHPHGKFVIKYGGNIVPFNTMNSVWSFFAAYFVIFVILMLFLMGVGIEMTTAFSAIAVTISNTGPGLGDITLHFGNVGNFGQFILSISMLLGRLEIFTILVLFFPKFWEY